MGAWGTAILEDDVTADVYADFMERFDAGMTPAGIRKELESDYADGIEDQDDGPLFWLALAKAQWECGRLQSDVLAKVSAIVTTGEGIALWQESGAVLLEERKQALTMFLDLLGKPNPHPRKRGDYTAERCAPPKP